MLWLRLEVRVGDRAGGGGRASAGRDGRTGRLLLKDLLLGETVFVGVCCVRAGTAGAG